MDIKTEKISENQIITTITNPDQKVIDFFEKLKKDKKELMQEDK